jgi:hypothetical protein
MSTPFCLDITTSVHDVIWIGVGMAAEPDVDSAAVFGEIIFELLRLRLVAAVRYDGRWLFLDNRNIEMRQDIDIAEFEPLFVINREGVKRMTAPAPTPPNLMVSASPAAGNLQFLSGW